jgi:dipeptidyl aminopeptidase/acylaminoacyl peptidase
MQGRVFLLFIFLLIGITVNPSSYAETLPIEAFGKLPESRSVKLSPDGKHFSFIQNKGGDTLIGVGHVEKDSTRYLVKTDNQEFKIDWYRWANNELLLVSVSFPRSSNGVKYIQTQLFKVSIDGEQPFERVFTPRTGQSDPQFGDNIVDLLPLEPDHILMGLTLRSSPFPSVYKVSLKSKTSRTLVLTKEEDVTDWITDQQHRVRLGFGRNRTTIYYRLFDLKSQSWRRIWDYRIFEAPDISPLGFGLDPNTLFIRANHQGRYAIFKVNVSDPDLKQELVYADPNYDVEGSLIYSKKTRDVIGVYHAEAKNSKVFFDDKYSKFQRSINAAIPNAYNNVSSWSLDENKYILYTSNPKSPGAYYVGDKKNNTLEFILERYPMLYQKKLSGKKKVSYKARDGLKIEAYVTEPHEGVENIHSALVIPHGGPMARNYGGFDWFSEFFANRGYTIIEPNFRGSSGYGFNFEIESVRKWGGSMQDDLVDAANWLSKNYAIDQSRTCIVGASYGGYAALMAAAKQSETFKCAASIAGVSDLRRLIRNARDFSNFKVVKKQIGIESNYLQNNSPVTLAESVDIPVLLLHGSDDRVVDVAHSREMYSALVSKNKDVKYVELPNGNHYLEIEANRLSILRNLEFFLNEKLPKE